MTWSFQIISIKNVPLLIIIIGKRRNIVYVECSEPLKLKNKKKKKFKKKIN